jgi:hypothetical protein
MTLLPGTMMARVNFLSKALTNWPITLNKVTDGSLAAVRTSRDNERNIWKHVWSAPVPYKVRVFGWRTAYDNLATKWNKFRRTLETDSTCNICGMT